MTQVVIVGRIDGAGAEPGKGAAQAMAAARLGASVTLISTLGVEATAWPTLEALRAAHVTLAVETQMQTVPAAEPDDLNAARLTAEALLRHAPLIARAKTLLLQNEIPLEVSIRAARIARSHGVGVIMGATPAPEPIWPQQTLAAFDFLTLPAHQAAEITERTVGSLQDAEICAEALTLLGSPGAIVTLGTQGAAWKIGTSQGHRAAGRVEAVDLLGGGDCFNATLAVFLAQGCTAEQAIEMAVDASLLAALRSGLPPSLSDLLAFRAQRAASPRRPH
ncbi:ribokinase [Roseobacter cerasinus]|uniref:Ribokinase n=1 Tax=Roseobacter cerasinus TaxID=2602289 RepID=A0A640VPP8_9RHOB|nr:PfkB family carbohydrate kinase [Roseobacter cerasinus]GFE50408.1 ribokinase [Roseobacter cerasinus]